MIRRRGFIAGLASLLAAPAIIRSPGLLMPIKPLVLPAELPFEFSGFESRIPLAQLGTRESLIAALEQMMSGPQGSWFVLTHEEETLYYKTCHEAASSTVTQTLDVGVLSALRA